MPSPAAAAHRDPALDRLARQRAAAILARVRAKVGDAEAHAVRALTLAMKAAPDGRATAARARRNPSAQAALVRLDELWEELAGPGLHAVAGTIRDAWEAAYESAYARHRADLPEVARSRSEEPTQAQRAAIRRTLIGGYELRAELQGPIGQARRSLPATLAQAGARSTPEHLAVELVRAWAARARDSIGRTAVVALLYGVDFSDTAAAWYAANPDLHHADVGPLGV